LIAQLLKFRCVPLIEDVITANIGAEELVTAACELLEVLCASMEQPMLCHFSCF